MNITTYSPALVLMFACTLLWILMDIHYSDFKPVQKWLVPLIIVVLAAANHLLRTQIGAVAYGRFLLLVLHLPTFLLFSYITRCGAIKMLFMIFSALVFTSPVVILGNFVRNILFVGSSQALLISNLLSYGVMLLLAQVVFRPGFNYLLKHGDNRLFLRLLPVPLMYYIYVLCAVNLDFSALSSTAGYIVRYFPHAEVFVFYFLLLYNYKELSEKRELEAVHAAMNQKLAFAEERIDLLNESQTRMAIYRHDMRHHLTVLEGLLSAGKPEQAAAFIKEIHAGLDSITPHRFCANETINLLCSAFQTRAERSGITLTTKVRLSQRSPIPDAELCSLLSNGLENALHAAGQVENQPKRISFYCEETPNKLLIEIKNPYCGKVIIQDDIPVSNQPGHGYGCRSIRTITERHNGLFSFDPNDGVFTLRVILPLQEEN